MTRVIKYMYYLLTVIFVVLTFYEVFVYLKLDSNYLGVFYLFFNFFIMFLLISDCFNYLEKNVSIRVSKNIFAFVLGMVSSFVIVLVVPSIFGYSDSSYLFNKKIFVVSKVIKPIIYLSLLVISFVEKKTLKRR